MKPKIVSMEQEHEELEEKDSINSDLVSTFISGFGAVAKMESQNTNQTNTNKRDPQKLINSRNCLHSRSFSLSGSVPGRARHSMFFIPSTSELFIFGGAATHSHDIRNDMYAYKLTTKSQWIKIDQFGHVPSPRECSNYVVFENRLYLWGGRTFTLGEEKKYVRHEGLYEFDPKKRNWQKVPIICKQTNKIIPVDHFYEDYSQNNFEISKKNGPGRLCSCCCFLHNDDMILIGGIDGSGKPRSWRVVHKISLKTFQYEKCELKISSDFLKGFPKGFLLDTSLLHCRGDVFYFYGGTTDYKIGSSSIIELNLNDNTIEVNNSFTLPQLFGHYTLKIDAFNSIVFGGYISDGDGIYPNQDYHQFVIRDGIEELEYSAVETKTKTRIYSSFASVGYDHYFFGGHEYIGNKKVIKRCNSLLVFQYGYVGEIDDDGDENERVRRFRRDLEKIDVLFSAKAIKSVLTSGANMLKKIREMEKNLKNFMNSYCWRILSLVNRRVDLGAYGEFNEMIIFQNFMEVLKKKKKYFNAIQNIEYRCLFLSMITRLINFYFIKVQLDDPKFNRVVLFHDEKMEYESLVKDLMKIFQLDVQDRLEKSNLEYKCYVEYLESGVKQIREARFFNVYDYVMGVVGIVSGGWTGNIPLLILETKRIGLALMHDYKEMIKTPSWYNLMVNLRIIYYVFYQLEDPHEIRRMGLSDEKLEELQLRLLDIFIDTIRKATESILTRKENVSYKVVFGICQILNDLEECSRSRFVRGKSSEILQSKWKEIREGKEKKYAAGWSGIFYSLRRFMSKFEFIDQHKEV